MRIVCWQAILMKYLTYFFRKLGEMSQNVSSAAVVMVNFYAPITQEVICFFPLLKCSKNRKTSRIRNRYNQAPHLSQNTKLESNKITTITNKSQDVSPSPSGNHKAATNRRESMTNTRQKTHSKFREYGIFINYLSLLETFLICTKTYI